MVHTLALGSAEVPPRMSKVHMIINLDISGYGGFQSMGVPPNHPLCFRIFHCKPSLIGGTIIFGNIHLVNPTSSIFLIKQSCELCRSIALHGQGARIESSPRGPSLYKSPKTISRDGSEWHQKGTCSVMILLFLI